MIRSLRVPMRHALCWLLSLALLSTSAFAEDHKAQLSPQGDWTYFTDREACLARRIFGAPKNPVTLQFSTRLAPGLYTIRASGRVLAALARDSSHPLAVTAQPANLFPDVVDADSFLAGDEIGVILGHFKLPYIATSMGSVAELALSRNQRVVTLASGALDAPFANLRSCMDGVLRGWGLDPVALRSMRSFPKAVNAPETWLTSKDYPAAYMRFGKIRVDLLLTVDASGKVDGCHARNDLNDAQLEALSCKLLTARARFEPGIDLSGHPTPSIYANTIDWVIRRPF